MSNVTDVCILADLYEPYEAELRALGFVNVADHAGGTKRLQASVWLAAFNYLNEGELRASLLKLRWRSHELGARTRVYVNREEDDGWSLWLEL